MLYEQLDRNRRMTVLLFAAFAVVVGVLAWALDALFLGAGPLATAAVGGAMVLGVLIFSWFAADRVVLGALGARRPNAEDPAERNLPDMISGLAMAAGMPVPGVYVVDDDAPNAFATGRTPDKGVTVFTTGLLGKMSRPQVEAVAAHELSHIANRDSMIGVVAAVLVGVVLIVCRLALRGLFFGGGRRRSSSRRSGGGGGLLVILGLVVLVLAPVFAFLLRLAISRRRESLADANAVRLTRNPDAMVGALEVLAGDETSVDFNHGLASHLWIEEPEHSQGSWLDRLTATHPPIPERIAALRAIAGDARYR